MQITDKDNGTTITVPIDSLVDVQLTWKPSTGYIWQAEETTAGQLISVRQDSVDEKPGAPVIVIFRFKILQHGTIILNYARPWNEQQPPVKWFFLGIKTV